MPRVPTYERRVEPRPLPTPQRGPIPGPEVFGAQQAEALAGVGSTITRAGASGLQVVLQQHELARRQAEEAQFVEADNQYSTWRQSYLYDPQRGILSPSNPASQGKQSLGLPDTVRKDHDAVVAEIGAELHGDRLQAAWRRRTVEQWHRIDADVQQHVATQNLKYQNNEDLKGIELAVSSALAHAATAKDAPPDSTIWQQQLKADLDDGLAKVHSFARRNGLGDQGTADMELGFTTAVHTGVIDGFLTDAKDKAAEAYFAATKDQINGKAQTDVRKALESGSVTGDAMRTAAEIWNTLGPKDEDAPIEYDTMQARAQELFPDDAKRYESTLHFLQQKSASVEAGRKARESATSSTVWQAVASGASLARVQTMPEFRRLSGEKKAQVSEHIVSLQERALNRANALESLAYTRESRAYTRSQREEAQRDNAGSYMFYQYARPEVAAKMSDDDVWNLLPQIGQRNVERLLEQRHTYKTTPAALDDFRSDTEVINSVFRAAEIDPTPKETEKPAMERVGFLRDQIAAEQNRVQANTKKKVTNEELKQIAKDVVGRTALTTPYWFGLVGPSQQRVIDFKFSDIPAEDIAALRKEFVKAGTPKPTQKQLLDAWRDKAMRERK